MSASTNPQQYAEDTFITDANFKVEINNKMKVPDKISFNTEPKEDDRDSWTSNNIKMDVPERILVAGQHQHVGTRAPPREIIFDNSLVPLEPYSSDLPRVATPPRTLTLDRYRFPGVDHFDDEIGTQETLIFKPNDKIHINETSIQTCNPLREFTPPLGVTEGITPAEEVLHLRRQLAKLHRRIMALEVENLNRLQKEKFIVGFGIAYIFFKVIIWINKN